jgi:hypothetical protein
VKACSICRNPYRTGTGTRVALVDGGKVVMVIACQRCTKKGVTVVSATPAPACSCGAPASMHSCGRCADKKSDKAARKLLDAKPILKGLRLRMKAYEAVKTGNDAELTQYYNGICEGLDQAMSYIEGGDWPKNAASFTT